MAQQCELPSRPRGDHIMTPLEAEQCKQSCLCLFFLMGKNHTFLRLRIFDIFGWGDWKLEVEHVTDVSSFRSVRAASLVVWTLLHPFGHHHQREVAAGDWGGIWK